ADDVAGRAAEDDVADAVGAAGDPIDAADAFIDAEHVAVATQQVHLAAVAEDDLAAGGRVDRVAGRAAENHVGALAALDVVRTADARVGSLDVKHEARRVAIDVAAVAEDHIVA